MIRITLLKFTLENKAKSRLQTMLNTAFDILYRTGILLWYILVIKGYQRIRFI